MGLHRRLHFVLGRLKFFLKRVPFIVLRELINAIAAAQDVLTDAESFRQFDDVSADIFYLLAVFRLNRNKAVRDQTTEIERNLGAILVVCSDWSPHLPDPVWLARFFQRGEKFTGAWNADGVELDRLGHLIGRQTPLFGSEHRTATKQNYDREESPDTPHGSPAYAHLGRLPAGNAECGLRIADCGKRRMIGAPGDMAKTSVKSIHAREILDSRG